MMAGVAGIALLQRHLAPPRAEELARMAGVLGGVEESLVAGATGTAVLGSPVYRPERGGWLVVAGAAGKPVPDEEGLFSPDPGPTLARLAGAFALAAWDGSRGRLILACDSQGGETLYYALARGRVCFATRVAALQEVLGESAAMDPVGMDQLFTLGAPVAPRTVFEGIERVPPGCWVEIDAHHPVLHRFALPAFHPEEVSPDDGAAGGLERCLESVLARTKGDAATSMAIGADPETAFDEPAGASLLRLAGPLERAAVESGSSLEAGDLEAAVRALESPLVSLEPVREGELGRQLRSRGRERVVTTAGGSIVSGESGLVAELAVRRGWARQPASPGRARLLDAIDPERLAGTGTEWRRALYGQGLNSPDAVTFSHLPRWDQHARIRALYRPVIREALPEDPLEELEQGLPGDFALWPGLHRALHLELTLWLGGRRPGSVLASMGIAAESPWLDPAVVAAAAARPRAAVLRRALHRARRGAGPYRAGNGIAPLLEAGEATLGSYLDQELVEATGLFDPDRVGRLVMRWRRGCRLTRADHRALLVVVTTGIWARHCLERSSHTPMEARA
jgi:asparagine synthase (glutamine-hydrolysing)